MIMSNSADFRTSSTNLQPLTLFFRPDVSQLGLKDIIDVAKGSNQLRRIGTMEFTNATDQIRVNLYKDESLSLTAGKIPFRRPIVQLTTVIRY